MSDQALSAPQPVANQQPDPRKRQRRRRSPLMTVLGWLGATLLLVLLLLALLVLWLLLSERTYAGRIYPNISVHGFDLGFHDIPSAHDAVDQHYASYLQQPVALVYGSQVWLPSAADLGMRLEVDTALHEAVSMGRTNDKVDSARTIAAIWTQGIDLPLRVSVDQQQMQHYLLSIAREVETPPRDAQVSLNGAQIVVMPEQWGQQVLIDETMHDITAALQGLQPQQITLRTREIVPTVRDSDIAATVDQLEMMLAGPIVFTSTDPPCVPGCRWEWTPRQVADWLHLKPTTTPEGRPLLTVQVDQTALQHALVPVARTLQRDGQLPRVSWNNGDLKIIQAGTPGVGLDVSSALTHFNTALQGGPRSFELALAETPPPVIDSDLSQLGITEVVGVGHSSFRNSEGYRITNIRAGARRMSGILIPPGGTFSFNEHLGPVDARNGFVQGYAIVENRTQKEWGGGLCQVSTTMFRAAFWAGLDITERHEHTFRISWYEELGEPPGLDATIFTGVTDMQFVNDTGSWLLTEAYVDLQRQQLTIMLYGQPSQREVLMSHNILSRTPPPARPLYINDPSLPSGTVRQTDWARGGMHVQVYRTVQSNGQIIHQDTFDTVFEPWPNIYLRGTG